MISLELCRHYPAVFGNCLAMSPALGWADFRLLKELKAEYPRYPSPKRGGDIAPGWIKDCRFWIDVGTMEGSTQANHNAMEGGLLQLEARLVLAGLKKGDGYDILIAEGAKHNEAAWAERFDKALMFLFPPQPPRRPPYNPAHGDSTPTPAPDPATPHDVAAR